MNRMCSLTSPCSPGTKVPPAKRTGVAKEPLPEKPIGAYTNRSEWRGGHVPGQFRPAMNVWTGPLKTSQVKAGAVLIVRDVNVIARLPDGPGLELNGKPTIGGILPTPARPAGRHRQRDEPGESNR